MADYTSALPVRTEGDLQEKLQNKIVDFVDPTLGAQVDADKNLHVELHGNDPAGTDRVVRLSESGNISEDGFYNVTTNSNPSSGGLIAHVRNAALTIVHQIKRLTAITSSVDTNVTALDVAIRDEQGNPFTAANPLPVTLVDSEGVEINDYKTTAAVAKNASVSHAYTVTAAKILKGAQVWVAASGKIKAEVQVETGVATGIFTNVFVGFNSTANTNINWDIKEQITVLAGVKFQVKITNLDAAQDVYSTVCGHEI